MKHNPFQVFLKMLQVGQENGTNCYDDSDLITVTEMLNLLLHSAETGESDCGLLYATLRMFLAKSDYEHLTLLLKTHLPTDEVEAIFDETAQEEPCRLSDDHPARRIGELGNQARSLGCALQNDEEFAEALNLIAERFWDLEKEYLEKTEVEKDRNELIEIISNAYKTFESRADEILAAGYKKP